MTAAVVLLFLLSGLFWLAPLSSEPMGVLFWRGGAYSDLLISHWPNAAFVRQSLLQWGQVPLWNPMILSGAPFAADPLSSLHYPPNWLAIAINPGIAFSVLAWLHIAWGGLGMWKLAKALGISSASALVAGLAFAGMPKLIGHIGLGHISLIFAVYWTPWILLGFDRAISRINAKSGALAGAALGLIFLIDPRWFLPLALLAGAFSLWRAALGYARDNARAKARGGAEAALGSVSSLNEEFDSEAVIMNAQKRDVQGSPKRVAHPSRDAQGSSEHVAHPSRDYWTRIATTLMIAGFMSLAISAVLAVPLGEFASLSTRASLTIQQSAELRLPPERIPNIIAPEYIGWPEWQIYAGAVVLFLALATLPSRAPGRWFWVGVIIVSLVFALGDVTPLFGVITSLIPGFDQLRVPPRSLFLSSFSLAVLAGLGLDQIRSGAASIRQLRILGAVLAGVALATAGLVWLRDQAALQAAAYLVSAALIGLSVLWIGISSRKPWQWSIAGWCLLIVFDLGLVNLSTVEARSGPDIPENWVSLEANNPRAYSPSYSLPQPAAASQGLELADGINPLQLASYAAYMSRATGYSTDGYSVTQPPFPAGDPQIKWGFKPDLDLMGKLSVSQFISGYRLMDTDLEFERTQEGLYYYSNPLARPRAWIDNGNPVEVMEWTPNRILIRATGPGKLVLSEIAYPGWEVETDGTADILETSDGVFRAVQLDTGEHEVELVFRPNSLRVGALITLLGLIILASLWIRR